MFCIDGSFQGFCMHGPGDMQVRLPGAFADRPACRGILTCSHPWHQRQRRTTNGTAWPRTAKRQPTVNFNHETISTTVFLLQSIIEANRQQASEYRGMYSVLRIEHNRERRDRVFSFFFSSLLNATRTSPTGYIVCMLRWLCRRNNIH